MVASTLGLAAYGPYAATAGNQAGIMSRTMFPYQFLFDPQGGDRSEAGTADTSAAASALPAYDDGGVISGSASSPTGIAAALAEEKTHSDPTNAAGDPSSYAPAGPGALPGIGSVFGGAAGGPLGAAIGYGLGMAANSAIGMQQPGASGLVGKGVGLATGMATNAALGPAAPFAGALMNVTGINKGITNAVLDAFGVQPSTSMPAAMVDNPAVTDTLMNAPSANNVGGISMTPGNGNGSGGGMGNSGGMSANAAEADPGGQGNMGSGPGFAAGGAVGQRSLLHGSGLIRSSTPGRADQVQATVPRGAYVLPADVVSTLGQGNTEAGAKVALGALKKFGRAKIGPVDPVKVRLSGGELAIHPAHVAALGAGSLPRGHAALDAVVQAARAKAASAAQTLPGPK
jgi:hypothetical protein